MTTTIMTRATVKILDIEIPFDAWDISISPLSLLRRIKV
jgi:hypothetical protein